MTSQLEKCRAFAQLHEQEDAWLIPNPWDVGSAKILQGLGFKALATTSSGFAYSLGRPDGLVTLQEKLNHCRQLSEATKIPINADFENGFADDVAVMQDNIKRLIDTGIAGLSIEDYSRDNKQLYEFAEAELRVNAAAAAIKQTGVPILLTARAENMLRGVDDLDDTIKRLQAYSAAGADVLYAPGISDLGQLKKVVEAIDKPFNVLASFIANATVQELSTAGACRISVGGALTWAALNPLLVAGKEMLEQGSFNWLGTMASGKEVQQLLASD